MIEIVAPLSVELARVRHREAGVERRRRAALLHGLTVLPAPPSVGDVE